MHCSRPPQCATADVHMGPSNSPSSTPGGGSVGSAVISPDGESARAGAFSDLGGSVTLPRHTDRR